MVTIVDLSAVPWNIELLEPFGIASGHQELAANVLVRLTLSDGTHGYGEAAPFPAVNGETQKGALDAVDAVKSNLIGKPIDVWRELATELYHAIDSSKSALCALETALLDAHCKTHQISLWSWAGGAERSLRTDITIPTGTTERAEQAAINAAANGFDQLKIKVGGVALDLDRQRILAALSAAPTASLLLDGNAAFEPEDAAALIDSLGPAKQRIVAFEQPTPKNDLAALLKVHNQTGLKVIADESAQNTADVIEIGRLGTAIGINIKIMKSGLLESLAMIASAREHGLELMMGGMVESDLAMGTSAALAAGVGGFTWIDLDTPLFMKGVVTEGGIRRNGARIDIDTAVTGHGVKPC